MLEQSGSVHYSGIELEGTTALGDYGIDIGLNIALRVKGLASLESRVEMRLI